ncbi:MAG: ArgE/DapE family deacylase [Nitrospinota bacterium]
MKAEVIYHYVDSHKKEILEELQDLVAIPTVNPPGEEALPAQRWFQGKLKGAGFETELVELLPGRPSLVGVMRGGGKGRSLILNGHIDVAEVGEDSSWTLPPFSGEVSEGKLWGRGSSDMKGGLIGMLWAVRAACEGGFKPEGDIIFESVFGEETSGPATRLLTERGFRADFGVVGESTKTRALISGMGCANLVITLRPPYSRHGAQRRLCIHAGGETLGFNPIEKMGRIMEALTELERYWGVFKSHPLIGKGSMTINQYAIEGGGNPHFMPNECRLRVLIYYLPGESVEDVKEEVEAAIKASAASDPWLKKSPPELAWLPPEESVHFPPTELDLDYEAIRSLREAYREVTGEEVQAGGRGSLTDAGWLYQAGIPSVVFGPGDFTRIHGIDEYIEVEDLLRYIRIMALFIRKWCGGRG